MQVLLELLTEASHDHGDQQALQVQDLLRLRQRIEVMVAGLQGASMLSPSNPAASPTATPAPSEEEPSQSQQSECCASAREPCTTCTCTSGIVPHDGHGEMSCTAGSSCDCKGDDACACQPSSCSHDQQARHPAVQGGDDCDVIREEWLRLRAAFVTTGLLSR